MTWKGRRLYQGELWASLGESIMGGMAEDIESSARSVLRTQAEWLKILIGVLHESETSRVYLTYEDQQWCLITETQIDADGLVHEVMCRHEDFVEFMKLVREYSDYVEGD